MWSNTFQHNYCFLEACQWISHFPTHAYGCTVPAPLYSRDASHKKKTPKESALGKRLFSDQSGVHFNFKNLNACNSKIFVVLKPSGTYNHFTHADESQTRFPDTPPDHPRLATQLVESFFSYISLTVGVVFTSSHHWTFLHRRCTVWSPLCWFHDGWQTESEPMSSFRPPCPEDGVMLQKQVSRVSDFSIATTSCTIHY